MSTPKLVVIGDIHFTPNTLELATIALCSAKQKAWELGVPLVINGDTLDTKAIMRGECVNRLIHIFNEEPLVRTYVSVGNHDRINEKSYEHTLNFLGPYCDVVEENTEIMPGVFLIPYHHDTEQLKKELRHIPAGSTLILHQGVMTANVGHYITDKTSIEKGWFADKRVIASHYHMRQDIKCGRPQKGAVGLFSYIGNPYTLNFGEANDGHKGYSILNTDGSLTFVPLNLRKHVVIDYHYGKPTTWTNPGADDLVWLKVRGPKSLISNTSKLEYQRYFNLPHLNFKLDLIPTDSGSPKVQLDDTKDDAAHLDTLIDGTGETDTQKTYLKQLWRRLLDETT